MSDVVTQSLEAKHEVSNNLLRSFKEFEEVAGVLYTLAQKTLERMVKDQKEASPDAKMVEVKKYKLQFCVWKVLLYAFSPKSEAFAGEPPVSSSSPST